MVKLILTKEEIGNRILWYFKQLFPLQYATSYYIENANDPNENGYFAVHWKMWFGRQYDINSFKIDEGMISDKTYNKLHKNKIKIKESN